MFGDAELDFGVLEYMQQRRMAFGLKNEGDQPANLELHLSSEDSASVKSWSVSVQQQVGYDHGYHPDVMYQYMSIFPLATMDCQCRQRHRCCRKMFLSVPPHVHWRIVLHFQPVNYELQACLRHYRSTLSLSTLAPSGSDRCVMLRSAVGYARLQIPSSLCSLQNEVISFSNVLYIPLRNAGSAPLHLLFRAEHPSNRLTVAATTDGDSDSDENRSIDRAPRLRLQTANCMNIADSILSTASPSPTTFQTPHKGDYSYFARTDEASTEYQPQPSAAASPRWQELRVPGGGRASLCVSAAAAAASASLATPPVRGILVLATRCACYVLHLEASATPLMQTTPGPLLHT